MSLLSCIFWLRPRSALTYILLIGCSCLAPLYFLHISPGHKQNSPIIHHRYLAWVKNLTQRGKLTDHAEYTHSHKLRHDANFDKFYLNASSPTPQLFRFWNKTTSVQCDGHFEGFGELGAMLHDILLDRSKCQGPKGGEEFHNLMNQPEDIEYLKYSPGFFTLPCHKEKPKYRFSKVNKSHLDRWMYNLVTGPVDKMDKVIDDFTIAITRYEYVNLYHTMTDYYNAFLVMAYFNKTQHQTNILILDAHPAGSLDSVWGTVFNSMTRVNQLSKQTRFTNLAFGILGYASPLFASYKNPGNVLPLKEEFRKFFLTSYNLPVERSLNCDVLNVFFIWRRDYVAHPRNPKGTIQRKIKNEDELVTKVKEYYPSFLVKGAQLDRFDMANQVKLVSEADILVGMHGAAMSHMLFMPTGRGIVELMPKYVTPSWRSHFSKMAGEKGHIYQRWVNTDHALEHTNFFTTVPPGVVLERIANIIKQMCVS